MINDQELPEGCTVLVRDEHEHPSAYEVISDGGEKIYTVKIEVREVPEADEVERIWVCSCPAYEYGEGQPCKHMKRLGVGHAG
jgi:hypothetical protein